MTSIEERIVSLGFNNQSFEKHAAQSLSTLDKLDQTLDAIGGAKGIGLLADTLEAVSSKFSVLGTIGDQVLRRISDSMMDVINKGGQLAKSLSVDQITAGWSKYADKTAAVQTIMAATAKDWEDTGAQMEYVSGQLDKLNWFTDETSYSFLDMVNNIGKFTSNGIALEDSVTSMQGISTWAAISGANVGEASRAMYNLSQALAVGSVKLMDWKSIENANMATREFKETALETAVNLGTLTKTTDAYGNAIYRTAAGHEFAAEQFNTYLSDAWFSKQVLQEVLGKYGDFANVLHDVSEETGHTATEILQGIDAYEKTGKVASWLAPHIAELTKEEYALGRRAFKAAQEAKTFAEALDATKDAVSTSWMNTFEKIFGNYEEAKTLWTGLANGLWEVFASGGEVRNEALDLWTELGQRARLFNDETGAIYRLGRSFLTLFDELHGGLLKVFGPDVDPGDYDEDVAQLYIIFTKITDKIESAADAMEIFTDRISKTGTFSKIFEGMHNMWKGIQVPFVLIGKAFHQAFDPVLHYPTEHPWIESLVTGMNRIARGFLKASEKFNEFMRSRETLIKFSNLAKGVAAVLDVAQMAVGAFGRGISSLTPSFTNLGVSLINFLSNLGKMAQAFRDGVRESGIFDRIMSTLINVFNAFAAVAKVVAAVLGKVFGLFTNNIHRVDGFGLKILDTIDTISIGIVNFCDKILSNGFFDTIFGIFEHLIELISNVCEFVSSHNPFQIIADGAKKAWKWLSDTFATIKKGFQSTFGTGNGLGVNIYKIAAGIGVLFFTIKKYMTGSSIKKFVDNLNDILENGFGSDSLFGKLKETIGGTLESVKGALNSFANETNSKALKNVAIALGILTASLLVLSLMDKKKLSESLLILTVGLGEMIGSLAILNMFKLNKGVTTDLIKVAASMLLFALAVETVAAALVVMAAAVWIMSKVDPERLWESIGALVVVFAAVAGALLLLSTVAKPGPMLAAGTAILEISVAVAILAVALMALALFPVDKLQGAVAVIAETLLVMVAALIAVSLAGAKSLAAATSLLILGAAIVVLAAALIVLSLIPMDTLTDRLLILGVALVGMVAALLILSVVGAKALIAAVAMAVLGAALVLAAAGILILSFALEKLAPIKGDIPKIAGGLAILGAAMLALGAGGLVAGLGIVGFAGLLVLALGLNMLDGLNLKQIAGGLALLAPALAALGLGGAVLLVGVPGLLLGGPALAVFAMGLTLLADALGKSLAELAEALPKLAEGFSAFETVSWSAIGEGAVALAAAVAALFVLQFATIHDGVPVLMELADALPGLAKGFSAFEEGAVWDAIPVAADALKTAISSLFKLQFATIRDGVPTLIELSEALPKVVEGFKSFDGLDPTSVTMAGDAITRMIKQLVGLEFATIRDGTGPLRSLGETLPTIAAGFHAFDGIEPDRLEALANALANGISVLTGNIFKNLFKGDKDFTAVANSILTLATAVSAFPEDSEDRLIRVANGLQAFTVVLPETLSKIAESLLLISDAVATTMDSISEKVQTTCDTIGIDVTAFTVNTENTINTSLANYLSVINESYISIIRNTKLTLTQIFSNLRDFSSRTSTMITELASSMIDRGSAITGNLANGINSNLFMVTTAVQSVVSTVNNTLDFYQSAYNSGWNVAVGVANGIYEGTYLASEAAAWLASQTLSAFNSTMGIASPSKEMMKSGRFIDEGLAKGIQNGSGEVEQTMFAVINPLLAAINAFMDEDMELSPTITPVVDMTNARMMAGTIPSLFNGVGTYTVNAAGRISANEIASGSGFGNYTNNVGGTTNVAINVYSQPGQNINELASEIERRFVRMNKQQRLGALG